MTNEEWRREKVRRATQMRELSPHVREELIRAGENVIDARSRFRPAFAGPTSGDAA